MPRGIHALEYEQGRGMGFKLKSYALHDGWELISGVLADFVSRIDVVMRLVPGTQCE
jgi:hypothetical protein